MLDVAVIGCGIVGANVAYLLSQHKLRAAVFEKENDVSMGTTPRQQRHHARGIRPDTPARAWPRLNVEGSAPGEGASAPKLQRAVTGRSAAWCWPFPRRTCATGAQLYHRGVANGVPGLQRVWTRRVRACWSPGLCDAVCGALYAPSAAIVNPWEYALALAETAVRKRRGDCVWPQR